MIEEWLRLAATTIRDDEIHDPFACTSREFRPLSDQQSEILIEFPQCSTFCSAACGGFAFLR